MENKYKQYSKEQCVYGNGYREDNPMRCELCSAMCSERAKDYALMKEEDKKKVMDKELIVEWFNHIVQMADDRKTANGIAMSDADTLKEIRCLAKNCVKYINDFMK